MTEKPSYLGLLNAISLGESEAECYLNCWAATTPRDDVRAVLQTVAIREGEHGKAFAKRINELGFGLIPKEKSDLDEKMAIVTSTELSDCEKFAKLKLGASPKPGQADFFVKFFEDTTMDIQTTALMGRYVGEERDSGRLLAACRCALEAETGNSTSAPQTQALEGLAGQLGRIETLLEKLVSAQG